MTETVVEVENVPLVPVNPTWKVPETPAGAVIAQLVEFMAPFDIIVAKVQVAVHAGLNEVELFVSVIVPVNPFNAVSVIVVEFDVPACALTMLAGFAEMLKPINLNESAAVECGTMPAPVALLVTTTPAYVVAVAEVQDNVVVAEFWRVLVKMTGTGVEPQLSPAGVPRLTVKLIGPVKL